MTGVQTCALPIYSSSLIKELDLPKIATRIVRNLPITKARINLGAVVKNIHLNKEYVVLEKDGIPIAGIMDIDEFEDYLELQDPKMKRQIAASRADVEAGRTRPFSDVIADLDAANAARSKRQKKQ